MVLITRHIVLIHGYTIDCCPFFPPSLCSDPAGTGEEATKTHTELEFNNVQSSGEENFTRFR